MTTHCLTYTVEPYHLRCTSLVIDRLVAFNDVVGLDPETCGTLAFARLYQDGRALAGLLCTCHFGTTNLFGAPYSVDESLVANGVGRELLSAQRSSRCRIDVRPASRYLRFPGARFTTVLGSGFFGDCRISLPGISLFYGQGCEVS